MTALACPDETTLSRLAQGKLDRPASEAVFFHLQSCDSCSSALESLAPGWSRVSLATPADVLSTFTRDVQDRLAANPPSLPEGGSRSAAIPHAIPVIPGLAELEPRFRGGMGIVYRACDVALRRPVAVKLLWPAAAGSEAAWARAKREALVLARISHANVVAVYSAGETGGSPYLVMEWVDGPSLQQRIDAELPTPRQAARIVRDLARAVDAVHALGIIHRDIKPDNVLLAGPDAADWNHCVPKLADFGLARPAELSQQLTQDTAALGTPAYMAPEQTGLAAELGEPGPAADIHGLGGLAFALLTGSPPHQAATATASLQQAARSEITWPAASRRLPRDVRAIVEKCLEREPARRYASAALLAEDLHRFVEGLPVRARPASLLRQLARAVRRRPVLAAAISLSAVFAAAAAGGLAYQVGRMDEAASSARQSIAVLEAATADLPDRDRELVRATLDLGMFLSQRQYEEGAAMIEKALSLMRTLREARPDDVSLVAQEAHALFTAQLCAWNAQRLDDCRRQAERLVTEIGGFLHASDTAASAGSLRGFLTQMVSVGCKRLAILAEMTGHADDAITFAQQRQRLCLEAVASLPEGDVESLRKELIDAEIEVAKLLRKTGRGAEAEAALEQAAKTARLLHDEQPGVWDHASLLALVCQQRAELAVARGERDAAARWFQEAITLMEPQLAKPARQKENEAQLAGARAGLHDLGERPDEPRRQTLTSRP